MTLINSSLSFFCSSINLFKISLSGSKLLLTSSSSSFLFSITGGSLKSFLEALKPALDIHYANNRHHPEHFPKGIRGMDLLDLLEMICDWKASSERHADGNIFNSIEVNQKRFADLELEQVHS